MANYIKQIDGNGVFPRITVIFSNVKNEMRALKLGNEIVVVAQGCQPEWAFVR